jgi:hypothetical protein
MLLLLQGCVAIQIGLYPNARFAPVDPATVQIYSSFPPDSSSFEVIGEFTVGETMSEYDSLFYQRLKRRVGEVGGNAVVIGRNLERVIGLQIPGAVSSTTTASGSAVVSSMGNTAVATGSMASRSTSVATPPNLLRLAPIPDADTLSALSRFGERTMRCITRARLLSRPESKFLRVERLRE